MDSKHFLSIAACLYASTACAEAPPSEAPSHDDASLEHHDPSSRPQNDVHAKDEAQEESNDTEDAEETDHEHEAEHSCAPPAPAVPAEEPLSKELQQEKALYEMNAYFDDYLCPRPFIIGSTEF